MLTPLRILVFITLLSAMVTPSIKAQNPRKLDENTGGSPNDEIKCGTCPCGTTCNPSPPPPVPSPPPPSPPPPPKKQPPTPTLNCPPPPRGGGGGGGGGSGQAPPNYIYITGPPGDLYPVVQSVNGGQRLFKVVSPVVLVVGLVGMMAFW